MRRGLRIAVVIGLMGAVACGFEERDDNDLMVIEDMDSRTESPTWMGVASDIESWIGEGVLTPYEDSDGEALEPEESDEPLEEEDEPEEQVEEEPTQAESPDLSCADDPGICRFCGPAQEVVESCAPGASEFECQVFEMVNQIREDEGLDPVTYNEDLAASAMIHAMDLSLCDYFSHDSLDGTSFFDRCHEGPYTGTCTGENIGGGQSSPQAVIDAWMDSPGHRDNILYPHHEELGVAYYEGDGNYGRYWLKHFGRP